jgi:hypothetical protein
MKFGFAHCIDSEIVHNLVHQTRVGVQQRRQLLERPERNEITETPEIQSTHAVLQVVVAPWKCKREQCDNVRQCIHRVRNSLQMSISAIESDEVGVLALELVWCFAN